MGGDEAMQEQSSSRSPKPLVSPSASASHVLPPLKTLPPLADRCGRKEDGPAPGAYPVEVKIKGLHLAQVRREGERNGAGVADAVAAQGQEGK